MNGALPSWIGEQHWRTFVQLFRFSVVGTVGFVIDSGVLLTAMALGAGPYGGRVLSYLAAATGTYTLNRLWTFRDSKGDGAIARQWAIFLAVNLVGFACNYGTYAALLATVDLVGAYPVLGVAAGSLAGLVGNFLLSRRFVFGQRTKPEGHAP